MGFIYPQLLWLFVALVPLLILWTFTRRAHERRLGNFMVRDNWGLLNPHVSTRARFHKGILILMALTLSIIAAARPYWGERERQLQQRGVNVIFALDVSQSMRAMDVFPERIANEMIARGDIPNRLTHAKRLIRQILAESKGHRVGIMPFAGDSFLQCPLTQDYSIAIDITEQVDFTTIGLEGTNIASVVETATEAFKNAGEGSRALVILTDGEDHSDEIVEAARAAADAGIRIFPLGIGSQDGAPIQLADGTFKEDRQGIKVLSKLNLDLIRTLAETTGGNAYASGGGMLDPDPIIADLNSLQKGEFGEETRVVREERFQWPLGLALICLMIEMLLHDRRRRVPAARAPKPVPVAAGGAR